jgi:ribosomal protein L11 methyltransferase
VVAWPASAEIVADFLAEASGTGVATEPAIEAFGPDEGYTLAADAPVTLKAYFFGTKSRTAREALRRTLRRAGLDAAIVGSLHWRTIRAEDWSESWKQYYGVERIGRVVVRPAWLQAETTANEVVVALDPGMAFGTGQHPTTRMCLALLQDVDLRNAAVLDVGTGSGILGLAAVALGADYCLAFDIEEQAVSAAIANLRLNGVGARMDVRLGSITDLSVSPFDVVLANISAAGIAALGPKLAAALKPDGVLFAGGIIEERMEEPKAALIEAGLAIERVVSDGDWRTLVARRARA